MATLESRLLALETRDSDHAKPLPDVVADDTPDHELERLRAGGREVYRMSDAVELFCSYACPCEFFRVTVRFTRD